MDLLLDRNASVDAPNKAGWTALHRAAYNGRVAACRQLLRRGASIHGMTVDCCTPLHLAAKNHHLGVMELLLDMGARTDFLNSSKQTPLDVCVLQTAKDLLLERSQQKADKVKAANAEATSGQLVKQG